MAFNLTAQLNIALNSASLRAASNQLNTALNSNTQVKLGIDRNSSSGLKQIKSQIDESTNAMESFGKQSGLAAKRFAAFSVTAGAFIAFTAAAKEAVSAAIDFDFQMVKLGQVSSSSGNEIKNVASEITRLATNYGVSSKELGTVAITLKQANLSLADTKIALESLAQAALAPNFENLKDTTEGAIAIMNQFKIEAKDLGVALGSVNAVAGEFAVEAGDIIEAIRKTGGAFKAAGGNLNELIALFTSVRQTTRESAESISTGLRTIFTRIQRNDTVEALRAVNIQLRYTSDEARALGDAKLENQFVGPYEAVKRLSAGLKGLQSTDPRFSAIVEQLGGYRQISKVIPLINEFAIAQKALGVAQAGSTSLSINAGQAQDALIIKFQKLKETFLEVGRNIVNSPGFRGLVDTFISASTSVLGLIDSLKGLLPLITALAAVKLFQGAASFTKGFLSAGSDKKDKKAEGGFLRMRTGGIVPGSGSGDKVRALLEPGELVVPRNQVARQKFAQNGEDGSAGKVKKIKMLPFKEIKDSVKNEFTHLDLGFAPRRDTEASRKYGKGYSNFAIDLPKSWNRDWGKDPNNKYVNKDALAKEIENGDIFKTYASTSKENRNVSKYKLKSDLRSNFGNKNYKTFLDNEKAIVANIIKNSSVKPYEDGTALPYNVKHDNDIVGFDTDPQVASVLAPAIKNLFSNFQNKINYDESQKEKAGEKPRYVDYSTIGNEPITAKEVKSIDPITSVKTFKGRAPVISRLAGEFDRIYALGGLVNRQRFMEGKYVGPKPLHPDLSAQEILGMAKGYKPNEQEVKKGFGRASLIHHPDRGGSNYNMGRVNSSYNYLKGGSITDWEKSVKAARTSYVDELKGMGQDKEAADFESTIPVRGKNKAKSQQSTKTTGATPEAEPKQDPNLNNYADESFAQMNARTGNSSSKARREWQFATPDAFTTPNRFDSFEAVRNASQFREKEEKSKTINASSAYSDRLKAAKAKSGGYFEGGPIIRMKKGGIVPGSGSGDKVRALLEPGELVVPKHQVARQKFSEGGGPKRLTVGDKSVLLGVSLSVPGLLVPFAASLFGMESVIGADAAPLAGLTYAGLAAATSISSGIGLGLLGNKAGKKIFSSPKQIEEKKQAKKIEAESKIKKQYEKRNIADRSSILLPSGGEFESNIGKSFVTTKELSRSRAPDSGRTLTGLDSSETYDARKTIEDTDEERKQRFAEKYLGIKKTKGVFGGLKDTLSRLNPLNLLKPNLKKDPKTGKLVSDTKEFQEFQYERQLKRGDQVSDSLYTDELTEDRLQELYNEFNLDQNDIKYNKPEKKEAEEREKQINFLLEEYDKRNIDRVTTKIRGDDPRIKDLSEKDRKKLVGSFFESAGRKGDFAQRVLAIRAEKEKQGISSPKVESKINARIAEKENNQFNLTEEELKSAKAEFHEKQVKYYDQQMANPRRLTKNPKRISDNESEYDQEERQGLKSFIYNKERKKKESSELFLFREKKYQERSQRKIDRFKEKLANPTPTAKPVVSTPTAKPVVSAPVSKPTATATATAPIPTAKPVVSAPAPIPTAKPKPTAKPVVKPKNLEEFTNALSPKQLADFKEKIKTAKEIIVNARTSGSMKLKSVGFNFLGTKFNMIPNKDLADKGTTKPTEEKPTYDLKGVKSLDELLSKLPPKHSEGLRAKIGRAQDKFLETKDIKGLKFNYDFGDKRGALNIQIDKDLIKFGTIGSFPWKPKTPKEKRTEELRVATERNAKKKASNIASRKLASEAAAILEQAKTFGIAKDTKVFEGSDKPVERPQVENLIGINENYKAIQPIGGTSPQAQRLRMQMEEREFQGPIIGIAKDQKTKKEPRVKKTEAEKYKLSRKQSAPAQEKTLFDESELAKIGSYGTQEQKIKDNADALKRLRDTSAENRIKGNLRLNETQSNRVRERGFANENLADNLMSLRSKGTGKPVVSQAQAAAPAAPTPTPAPIPQIPEDSFFNPYGKPKKPRAKKNTASSAQQSNSYSAQEAEYRKLLANINPVSTPKKQTTTESVNSEISAPTKEIMNRNIAEQNKPKKRKEKENNSLARHVILAGGIKPSSITKDFNFKTDIRDFGLTHVMRKDGNSLDVIASSLEAQGHFITPEDRQPDDYLLELLQNKKHSLLEDPYGEEEQRQYYSQRENFEGKTKPKKRKGKPPEEVIPFAKGGLVPGTGNSDTVPMDLPENSFVIRKSSVNKIGAANLAKQARFASGGTVPALVTPGEYIYTPEEASKIGSSKLHRMNKYAKFARGGFTNLVGADFDPNDPDDIKKFVETLQDQIRQGDPQKSDAIVDVEVQANLSQIQQDTSSFRTANAARARTEANLNQKRATENRRRNNAANSQQDLNAANTVVQREQQSVQANTQARDQQVNEANRQAGIFTSSRADVTTNLANAATSTAQANAERQKTAVLSQNTANKQADVNALVSSGVAATDPRLVRANLALIAAREKETRSAEKAIAADAAAANSTAQAAAAHTRAANAAIAHAAATNQANRSNRQVNAANIRLANATVIQQQATTNHTINTQELARAEADTANAQIANRTAIVASKAAADKLAEYQVDDKGNIVSGVKKDAEGNVTNRGKVIGDNGPISGDGSIESILREKEAQFKLTTGRSAGRNEIESLKSEAVNQFRQAAEKQVRSRAEQEGKPISDLNVQTVVDQYTREFSEGKRRGNVNAQGEVTGDRSLGRQLTASGNYREDGQFTKIGAIKDFASRAVFGAKRTDFETGTEGNKQFRQSQGQTVANKLIGGAAIAGFVSDRMSKSAGKPEDFITPNGGGPSEPPDPSKVEAYKATMAFAGALTKGTTYAAAAGQSLAQFGPVVAGIGAGIAGLVGAIQGYSDSLEEAEKAIREQKIAVGLKNLEDIYASVANGLVEVNAVTIRNIQSNQEDIQKSKSEQLLADAGGNTSGFSSFLNTVSFGALGKEAYDPKKLADSTNKSRKEDDARAVTQSTMVLNKISSTLGKDSAKELKASGKDITATSFEDAKPELLRKLRDENSGFGKAEISKIASTQNISIPDAEKQFLAAMKDAFESEKAKEVSLKQIETNNKTIASMALLSGAVNAAAAAADNFNERLSLNNDLFEGNAGSTKITSQADRIGMSGSNPNFSQFNAAISESSGLLGDYGQSFKAQGNAVNVASQILPEILANSAANPVSGKDPSTQIVEALRAGLKERGITGAEADKVVNSVGGKVSAEEFTKQLAEAGGDVGKATEKLLSDIKDPLVAAFKDIDAKLTEQSQAYISGLENLAKRQNQILQEFDKLAGLKSQQSSFRASEAQRSPNARYGSEESRALDVARNAQAERQMRLTGLGRGGSQDSGVIAARLKEAEKKAEKQSLALDSTPKDKQSGSAFRDAALELTKTKNEAANLKTALKNLTDQSGLLEAAQKKLASVRSGVDEKRSFGRKLLTQTPEEQDKMLRGQQIFNQVKASGGSLQGMSTEENAVLFDFLDNFGSAGKKIQEQILDANGYGASQDDLSEEKALVALHDRLYQEQINAQQLYIVSQQGLQNEYFTKLEDKNKTFYRNLEKFTQELTKNEKSVERNKEQQKLAKIEDVQKNAKPLADVGITNKADFELLNKNRPQVQELANTKIEKMDLLKASKAEINTTVERTATGAPKNISTISNDLKNAGYRENQIAQIITKITTEGKSLKEARKSVETSERGTLIKKEEKQTDALKGNQKLIDVSNSLASGDISSETMNRALENIKELGVGTEELSVSAQEARANIKRLENEISNLGGTQVGIQQNPQPTPPKPVGLALADGGSVFTPRGTDTVPAMLTPGEFVVNKSATQQNLPLLRSINSGATSYLSRGGQVGYYAGGTNDPIPAQESNNIKFDDSTSYKNFLKIREDQNIKFKKMKGAFEEKYYEHNKNEKNKEYLTDKGDYSTWEGTIDSFVYPYTNILEKKVFSSRIGLDFNNALKDSNLEFEENKNNNYKNEKENRRSNISSYRSYNKSDDKKPSITQDNYDKEIAIIKASSTNNTVAGAGLNNTIRAIPRLFNAMPFRMTGETWDLHFEKSKIQKKYNLTAENKQSLLNEELEFINNDSSFGFASGPFYKEEKKAYEEKKNIENLAKAKETKDRVMGGINVASQGLNSVLSYMNEQKLKKSEGFNTITGRQGILQKSTDIDRQKKAYGGEDFKKNYIENAFYRKDIGKENLENNIGRFKKEDELYQGRRGSAADMAKIFLQRQAQAQIIVGTLGSPEKPKIPAYLESFEAFKKYKDEDEKGMMSQDSWYNPRTTAEQRKAYYERQKSKYIEDNPYVELSPVQRFDLGQKELDKVIYGQQSSIAKDKLTGINSNQKSLVSSYLKLNSFDKASKLKGKDLVNLTDKYKSLVSEVGYETTDASGKPIKGKKIEFTGSIDEIYKEQIKKRGQAKDIGGDEDFIKASVDGEVNLLKLLGPNVFDNNFKRLILKNKDKNVLDTAAGIEQRMIPSFVKFGKGQFNSDTKLFDAKFGKDNASLDISNALFESVIPPNLFNTDLTDLKLTSEDRTLTASQILQKNANGLKGRKTLSRFNNLSFDYTATEASEKLVAAIQKDGGLFRIMSAKNKDGNWDRSAEEILVENSSTQDRFSKLIQKARVNAAPADAFGANAAAPVGGGVLGTNVPVIPGIPKIFTAAAAVAQKVGSKATQTNPKIANKPNNQIVKPTNDQFENDTADILKNFKELKDTVYREKAKQVITQEDSDKIVSTDQKSFSKKESAYNNGLLSSSFEYSVREPNSQETDSTNAKLDNDFSSDPYTEKLNRYPQLLAKIANFNKFGKQERGSSQYVRSIANLKSDAQLDSISIAASVKSAKRMEDYYDSLIKQNNLLLEPPTAPVPVGFDPTKFATPNSQIPLTTSPELPLDLGVDRVDPTPEQIAAAKQEADDAYASLAQDKLDNPNFRNDQLPAFDRSNQASSAYYDLVNPPMTLPNGGRERVKPFSYDYSNRPKPEEGPREKQERISTKTPEQISNEEIMNRPFTTGPRSGGAVLNYNQNGIRIKGNEQQEKQLKITDRYNNSASYKAIKVIQDSIDQTKLEESFDAQPEEAQKKSREIYLRALYATLNSLKTEDVLADAYKENFRQEVIKRIDPSLLFKNQFQPAKNQSLPESKNVKPKVDANLPNAKEIKNAQESIKNEKNIVSESPVVAPKFVKQSKPSGNRARQIYLFEQQQKTQEAFFAKESSEDNKKYIADNNANEKELKDFYQKPEDEQRKYNQSNEKSKVEQTQEKRELLYQQRFKNLAANNPKEYAEMQDAKDKALDFDRKITKFIADNDVYSIPDYKGVDELPPLYEGETPIEKPQQKVLDPNKNQYWLNKYKAEFEAKEKAYNIFKSDPFKINYTAEQVQQTKEFKEMQEAAIPYAELKDRLESYKKLKGLLPIEDNDNLPPLFKATGGNVPSYRSNPNPSYFKSRGTDTVPAMLTPGEFVVNAAATAKHGDLLNSINSGRGVSNFALGGKVSYLAEGAKVKEAYTAWQKTESEGNDDPKVMSAYAAWRKIDSEGSNDPKVISSKEAWSKSNDSEELFKIYKQELSNARQPLWDKRNEEAWKNYKEARKIARKPEYDKRNEAAWENYKKLRDEEKSNVMPVVSEPETKPAIGIEPTQTKPEATANSVAKPTYNSILWEQIKDASKPVVKPATNTAPISTKNEIVKNNEISQEYLEYIMNILTETRNKNDNAKINLETKKDKEDIKNQSPETLSGIKPIKTKGIKGLEDIKFDEITNPVKDFSNMSKSGSIRLEEFIEKIAPNKFKFPKNNFSDIRNDGPKIPINTKDQKYTPYSTGRPSIENDNLSPSGLIFSKNYIPASIGPKDNLTKTVEIKTANSNKAQKTDVLTERFKFLEAYNELRMFQNYEEKDSDIKSNEDKYIYPGMGDIYRFIKEQNEKRSDIYTDSLNKDGFAADGYPETIYPPMISDLSDSDTESENQKQYSLYPKVFGDLNKQIIDLKRGRRRVSADDRIAYLEQAKNKSTTQEEKLKTLKVLQKYLDYRRKIGKNAWTEDRDGKVLSDTDLFLEKENIKKAYRTLINNRTIKNSSDYKDENLSGLTSQEEASKIAEATDAILKENERLGIYVRSEIVSGSEGKAIEVKGGELRKRGYEKDDANIKAVSIFGKQMKKDEEGRTGKKTGGLLTGADADNAKAQANMWARSNNPKLTNSELPYPMEEYGSGKSGELTQEAKNKPVYYNSTPYARNVDVSKPEGTNTRPVEVAKVAPKEPSKEEQEAKAKEQGVNQLRGLTQRDFSELNMSARDYYVALTSKSPISEQDRNQLLANQATDLDFPAEIDPKTANLFINRKKLSVLTGKSNPLRIFEKELNNDINDNEKRRWERVQQKAGIYYSEYESLNRSLALVFDKAANTGFSEPLFAQTDNQAKQLVAFLQKDTARNTAGPTFFSNGGNVPSYRANPNPSYFKPKGTDTVPAMLSPGEFVINAGATAKHSDLLSAINSGQDVNYSATGGPVSYLKRGKSRKELQDKAGFNPKDFKPLDRDATGDEIAAQINVLRKEAAAMENERLQNESLAVEKNLIGNTEEQKNGDLLQQIGEGQKRVGDEAGNSAREASLASLRQTGIGTTQGKVGPDVTYTKPENAQNQQNQQKQIRMPLAPSKNEKRFLNKGDDKKGTISPCYGCVETQTNNTVDTFSDEQSCLSVIPSYNEGCGKPIVGGGGGGAGGGAGMAQPPSPGEQIRQEEESRLLDEARKLIFGELEVFSKGGMPKSTVKKLAKGGSVGYYSCGKNGGCGSTKTCSSCESGGPSLFNDGGLSLAPSDTIPAMLTPGEFVVNAKSSAKNASLLHDINSGKDVEGFATGGSVGYYAGGKSSGGSRASDRLIGAARDLSASASELSNAASKISPDQTNVNPIVSSRDPSSFVEIKGSSFDKLTQVLNSGFRLEELSSVLKTEIRINQSDIGALLGAMNTFGNSVGSFSTAVDKFSSSAITFNSEFVTALTNFDTYITNLKAAAALIPTQIDVKGNINTNVSVGMDATTIQFAVQQVVQDVSDEMKRMINDAINRAENGI